jgi:hypothetical protein
VAPEFPSDVMKMKIQSGGWSELTSDSEFIIDLVAKIRKWYLDSAKVAISSFPGNDQLRNDAGIQMFWETWTLACDLFGSLPNLPGHPAEILGVNSSSARRIYEYCLLVDYDLSTPSAVAVMKEAIKEQFGISLDDFFQIYEYLNLALCGTFANGSRLCSLTTGKLALIQPGVEMRDLVYHVRGGYLPLVLREVWHDSKPGRAQLVAACCVHGEDNVYKGDDWENWEIE